MRPTILIAESSNFSDAAARRLAESGQTILADLDRPALLKAAATADVLWVRLRHRIDREVMIRPGDQVELGSYTFVLRREKSRAPAMT